MDLSIDFAIWLLEIDGLQVAPFDKHSEVPGNGLLRDMGFTSDEWQTWLHYLVSESAGADQQAMFSDTKPGDFFESRNQTWQMKLNELWEVYLPISNSRRYVEYAITTQNSPTPREGRILWDTLSEIRGDLASLQVIVNAYPAKIQLPVAPCSLLLAPGGALISLSEWETLLTNGIHTLRGMSNS